MSWWSRQEVVASSGVKCEGGRWEWTLIGDPRSFLPDSERSSPARSFPAERFAEEEEEEGGITVLATKQQFLLEEEGRVTASAKER